MPWVRIDDRFAQHPKVVAAGPLAMAMQVAALGYCNRELTDGFLPRAVARTLLDCDAEAGVSVDAGWVIGRLVEAGMWDEAPGGYQIHDYLVYQPSKEQVLKEREQTARRVSAWRERNVVSNDVTNKEGNAPVTDAPKPVPVPNPETPKPTPKDHPPTPRKRGSDAGYTVEFLQFMDAYGPTDGAKKPAFTNWKKLTAEQRVAALAGLLKWHASQKWHDGYKVYPQRYLSEKFWEQNPAAARANPNGYYADAEPKPTPEEAAELERKRRESLAKDGETSEERWARTHPEQAAGLGILKSSGSATKAARDGP